MRERLTREFGGAPLWLLLLIPVALVVGGVLAVVGATRPAPPAAHAGPAYTAVPEPTAARFTKPADPRLLVFGDSYTEGYAATPPQAGYAYLVGKRLGWKTQVNGAGGTGYTFGGLDGGTSDYGTRIRDYIRTSTFDPNVIVLEGSQNDYRSVGTITRSVVQDVNLLQKAYPGVRIVLFGPAAPQPLLSRLGPIDAAVQAAATETALPYISPYQDGWLTQANTKQYGFTDGSHLNTAGHQYLAGRFLADFDPLFGLPAQR